MALFGRTDIFLGQRTATLHLDPTDSQTSSDGNGTGTRGFPMMRRVSSRNAQPNYILEALL